jgi:bacterioferritin
MKGDPKVLEVLNQLLADELTAINQYMVHSEMCANWEYDRLHEAIEKQAVEEMHHAETHIARILFLEGVPIVSKLNLLKIGATVAEMIAVDLQAELDAIKAYNAGIKVAMGAGDEGTAELLRKIVQDEERHADWNEAQRDQMAQMGVENYLATQNAEEK